MTTLNTGTREEQMAILQSNSLTGEQIAQVRTLEAVCARSDGAEARISLDNGINAERDMDSFFLLYEHDTLLGLVSVFAPTKDVAEISACVHPAHRLRGYFRRLLERASAEVSKYGYKKLLLVHEASTQDGKAVAQKWNLAVEHSEYRLRFTDAASFRGARKLTVRPAREEDMAAMVGVSIDAFEESEEDARRQIEKGFRDPTRKNYIALADGETVGICGVSTADPEQYLFGIGVASNRRGKGYGRDMLEQVISLLRSESDRVIELEVDSENARAFQLYITSGFEVRSQYDYYEVGAAEFIGTD